MIAGVTPQSSAAPPGLLNRRHGRALHCFSPAFAPLPFSLSATFPFLCSRSYKRNAPSLEFPPLLLPLVPASSLLKLIAPSAQS